MRIVMFWACLWVFFVAQELAAGEQKPAENDITISAQNNATQVPTDGITVNLRAPLTTVLPLSGTVKSGPCELRAVVFAPHDIPSNIGIGGFVADRHGRWYQCNAPSPIRPGINYISIPINPSTHMRGEPHRGAWDSVAQSATTQAGLFMWSMQPVSTPLTVSDMKQVMMRDQEKDSDPVQINQQQNIYRLQDLHYEQQNNHGDIHITTGARWTASVKPVPFPSNPYDPQEFSLDAVFKSPSGQEIRIPGFALEPTALVDRGDKQIGIPIGACHFAIRWRPPEPGLWTGHLEATWNNEKKITITMPSIHVEGHTWDDYVRNDEQDVRFFRVGKKWYWPIGVNLHSTFDERSRQRLGTILTPERGTEAYAAQFKRLAGAGGNATEIWMSSWNTALEWNADWPGYGGVGRYNQFHAAKMDRILDDAYANGIRINLVINNHGQASPSNDREWKDNPWNKENGGPFIEPYQLFYEEQAYVGQANLRRYLVARYADHPAVLGWKLYSEINLTAMGDRQRSGFSTNLPPIASYEQRVKTRSLWHERAAAHMREIDSYKHGITTHWSGDYRKPYPEICSLPGIDYICIDAYHSGGRSASRNNTLVDLIYFGMLDPNRGLGKFNKPVWVTEFGGTSQGGSSPELIAELASAGWSAMVSGNAGMPMLWWFEWIDQGDRWQAFGAIRRFLIGEDFRGKEARGVVLAGRSDQGSLWTRAWARPGRMLGYIVDHNWAADGTSQSQHTHAVVSIGTQISAGPCYVAWWDADRGVETHAEYFSHPGGPLSLTVPPFVRHCAFKLTRTQQPTANETN